MLLISISNESFSQANIAKTIGVDILENARGVSKIRQSYYLIDEVGNQLVMISDELADESLPKILSKLEKPTDRILLLAAHARATLRIALPILTSIERNTARLASIQGSEDVLLALTAKDVRIQEKATDLITKLLMINNRSALLKTQTIFFPSALNIEKEYPGVYLGVIKKIDLKTEKMFYEAEQNGLRLYIGDGSEVINMAKCAERGTFEKSSTILRNNLKDAGFNPKPGEEAHHIIPKSEELAVPARIRLAQEGIDIDDPINGVFLSKELHNKTLLYSYIRKVNGEIVNAPKGTIKDVLSNIRTKLLKGTY